MIRLLQLPVIIGSLPNTLTNGTTADATQVMADLNFIVNQVNANAAPLATTALTNANNNFTVVQSGIAASQAANFPIASQVQNQVFNTLTSTLGTNAITARCAALPLTAYASGQVFTFIPSQTNTGPANITVDAAGSTIIFQGGATLIGGELRAGIPARAEHDGAKLNLVGPIVGGQIPGDVTFLGSATISGITKPLALLDISGPNAGQIKFPANQNASAEVNTLDDYEEGTWTPALGGTATYTTQTGRYTKTGRQVSIECSFQVNVIGTGSTSTISGSPFAVGSAGSQGLSVCLWSSSANAWAFVSGYAFGSTFIITGNSAASATLTNDAAPFFGNSSLIRFSTSYSV